MQTFQIVKTNPFALRKSNITRAQVPYEWEPKPSNPLDRIFGKRAKDVERVVLEAGKPKYYVDKSGKRQQVLSCDYGFRNGGQRIYQGQFKYGNIPRSVWDLGIDNFNREVKNIGRSLSELPQLIGSIWSRASQVEEGFTQLAQEQKQLLDQLRLDTGAVDKREKALMEAGVYPKTHPAIYWAYRALCIGLDLVYANASPVRRFWVLEVVARMPYFSYVSVLHLYETLGWWKSGSDLRKVHFAEEWNEMHHMEIMESLGGDVSWLDRFMAYHAAMAYYWVLVGLYLVTPAHSYDFSTLVETHAFETYSAFLDGNSAILKQLPPPLPAVQYYLGDDVYMFEAFQTSPENSASPRKPTCTSLYDTFRNIRDDEGEHVHTMVACHDAVIGQHLDAKYGDTGKELEDNQEL